MKPAALLLAIGIGLLAACDPEPTAVDKGGKDTVRAQDTLPKGPAPMATVPVFLGAVVAIGDDSLSILSPPDTQSYCEDSTLMSQVRPEEPSTFSYRIHGDTLEFGLDQRNVDFEGEPTARIEEYWELFRVTGASGILGRWRGMYLRYRVVSGTLRPEDRESLDSRSVTPWEISGFLEMEIEITPTFMLTRWDGDFSGYLKKEWEEEFRPDGLKPTDRYDIDFAIVDRWTVRLKGLASGETVTITFGKAGKSRRYESDKLKHPPYYDTDRWKPILSCPAKEVLDWYPEFLDDNWIGPRAQSKLSLGNRPKTPIFDPLRALIRNSGEFPALPLKRP